MTPSPALSVSAAGDRYEPRDFSGPHWPTNGPQAASELDRSRTGTGSNSRHGRALPPRHCSVPATERVLRTALRGLGGRSLSILTTRRAGEIVARRLFSLAPVLFPVELTVLFTRAASGGGVDGGEDDLRDGVGTGDEGEMAGLDRGDLGAGPV
jgi:hypothetical protein